MCIYSRYVVYVSDKWNIRSVTTSLNIHHCELTNPWKVRVDLSCDDMLLVTLTHICIHTHLSRLCFFPLFFFFSLRVGDELPNLLMERRRHICQPQIAAKFWFFIMVLHYITPQWGSLLAKVSSDSSSADFSYRLFLLNSSYCLSFLLIFSSL